MSGSGGLVVVDDSDKAPRTEGGLADVNEKGEAHFFADRAKCDIVFVIDTTGSMSDKIAGLIGTCQTFIDRLVERGIDWQVAIVGFGDLTVQGDTIQATDFSGDVRTVKRRLAAVPRNSGGGNSGESSLEALDRALTLGGYRSGSMKVFVFMTDEGPLTHNLTPNLLLERLISSGVLTFVISDPLPEYMMFATSTGGDWFQICSGADFLSILDRLMTKVTRTVAEVAQIAGGSVAEYLRLKGSS